MAYAMRLAMPEAGVVFSPRWIAWTASAAKAPMTLPTLMAH